MLDESIKDPRTEERRRQAEQRADVDLWLRRQQAEEPRVIAHMILEGLTFTEIGELLDMSESEVIGWLRR